MYAAAIAARNRVAAVFGRVRTEGISGRKSPHRSIAVNAA